MVRGVLRTASNIRSNTARRTSLWPSAFSSGVRSSISSSPARPRRLVAGWSSSSSFGLSSNAS
jgi:hypothetical protein